MKKYIHTKKGMKKRVFVRGKKNTRSLEKKPKHLPGQSSLFGSAKHDLGDETDDGASWLVWL